MKSLLSIYNLKNSQDTRAIKTILSSFEGLIACEISLKKKEIQLVYDNLTVDIEEIILAIEMAGYMIIN